MSGTMMENFKSLEFQLYGYLIQLRELLKTSGMGDGEIEKINQDIELIKNRRFNIAVMGEFKRGKSTLINAILGTRILPSDVTPTTATINRITYGTEPSMTINYHDGTSEKADIKDISRYVTMLTEEGLKRASEIREAVIQYPTIICQNYIDIIDTPGLNDNLEMTKTAMSLLSNIDATIVVVSALSPFSEKERDFVCELLNSDNIVNILFVVTYIDEIDEEEQDKFINYIHSRIKNTVIENLEKQAQEACDKARRLLNKSLIFGVSSTLALKAFVTGDRELLLRSRFEVFKTSLFDFLTAEQGINVISKASKNIKAICRDFEELYANRIMKLQQELTVIDEKAVSIDNYCKNCEKNFYHIFSTVEGKLKNYLNNVNQLTSFFITSLTEAINSNQGKGADELISALSSKAAECFDTANGEFMNIHKNLVINGFKEALDEYANIRRRMLVEPAAELKRVCGIDYNISEIFNEDIENIMINFGFPKFSWQAPIFASAEVLLNGGLIRSIKNAVNLSVKTFHKHWSLYISGAKQSWLQIIQKEAHNIAAFKDQPVKTVRENKNNELILLKNTYDRQRSTAKDIEAKAEEIYNNIFNTIEVE